MFQMFVAWGHAGQRAGGRGRRVDRVQPRARAGGQRLRRHARSAPWRRRSLSLDADPPDLVLLDLGLPDGDGAVVAVHAAREHPTVPVIVLTARDSEVDVVLGLEAGAVDYVVKPFRLAELLARIASHLRMREAHTQPRRRPSRIELDDLAVDVAARRVTLDGTEIALAAEGVRRDQSAGGVRRGGGHA